MLQHSVIAIRSGNELVFGLLLSVGARDLLFHLKHDLAVGDEVGWTVELSSRPELAAGTLVVVQRQPGPGGRSLYRARLLQFPDALPRGLARGGRTERVLPPSRERAKRFVRKVLESAGRTVSDEAVEALVDGLGVDFEAEQSGGLVPREHETTPSSEQLTFPLGGDRHGRRALAEALRRGVQPGAAGREARRPRRSAEPPPESWWGEAGTVSVAHRQWRGQGSFQDADELDSTTSGEGRGLYGTRFRARGRSQRVAAGLRAARDAGGVASLRSASRPGQDDPLFEVDYGREPIGLRVRYRSRAAFLQDYGNYLRGRGLLVPMRGLGPAGTPVEVELVLPSGAVLRCRAQVAVPMTLEAGLSLDLRAEQEAQLAAEAHGD